MPQAMQSNCSFCDLIRGAGEVSMCFEDSDVVAFMDIQPVNAGHVLVVPRLHVRDIFELDDATGAALMATVTRVARAVRGAFAPDGINIMQSNGEAAGQEVFHLHMHVLPRHEGDGLLRVYGSRADMAPRSELDVQAAAIRETIGKMGNKT